MRELSLKGKVLIVKAVILPLILYIAVVVPMGKIWVIKINKVLFGFLWGSRMERIARETVKRTCSLGGLGFPDQVKYVDMHYWLVAFRTVMVDRRTAVMMPLCDIWGLVVQEVEMEEV